jgi:hypothetical protein
VPDAANYYIESVLQTISDPAVDGTFTDDVTGLPAEHDNAPKNCNLTAQEVTDIQFATQAANQRLIDLAVAAGKYVWQAFGAQDGVGQGVSKGNCAGFVRNMCQPSFQSRAITYSFDSHNANQSIAAFLIGRPPIAFAGFGWESDMRDWNSAFLYQVGEPQALCYESSANVFTRQWTYGNVTLDCNTYTATIPTA